MLVEVLCETDFVSKSPAFHSLVQRVSLSSVVFNASTTPEILASHSCALDAEDTEVVPGESIAQSISRASYKMGENIKIGRVLAMDGVIGGYVHSSGTGGVKTLGSIAALVKLRVAGAADHALLGKSADKIAQHVVALSPGSVEELQEQEMFLGGGESVGAYCESVGKDLSCRVNVEEIVRMAIGEEVDVVQEDIIDVLL
jgi:translation elongation factor EF-Ts